MTRQEMFNISYLGLKAQGFQSSMSTDPAFGKSCMYRGGEGRKCAIGHLIPDDRYNAGLEHGNVHGIFYKMPDLFKLEDRHFLYHLQRCHDDAVSSARHEGTDVATLMQENLKVFARNNELTIPT